jgi:iron complex transport system substrate-binding protein
MKSKNIILKSRGINLLLCLKIYFITILSCTPTNESDQNEVRFSTDGSIEYARHFSIEKHKDHKIVNVIRPSGKNKGVNFQYFLSSRKALFTEVNNDAHFINTPLKTYTIRSSGEASMLHLLDELDGVIAIANQNWICSDYLHKKYLEDEIALIGRGKTINTELLLDLNPDAVFELGSGNQYDITRQLLTIGLTPVMNSMHLEDHPLGMAEWIKYYAAFFNKEEKAKMIFDSIAYRYNELVLLTKNIANRPTVIVGHSRRGVWSTHGSSNWFIKYLKDAGATYILEDSTEYNENLISMEQALLKGGQADFWINPDHKATKINDLLHEDERYQYFKSIKSKNVFNNNRWVTGNGCNHYWEEGVMEPHILLADLIRIFHPELLPNHQLKYYQQLQ